MKEHLGAQLGVPEVEWAERDDGSPLPFLVARFDGAPVERACTFTTAGLSREVLTLPNGKTVRHELLVSCYRNYADWDVPELLHGLGEIISSERRSVVRGEVIRTSEPPLARGQFTALYCAMPFYFGDELHVLRATNPPTVFVFLVPLFHEEADFVEERGWDTFEDLLFAQDPDFLDFERTGMDLSQAE